MRSAAPRSARPAIRCSRPPGNQALSSARLIAAASADKYAAHNTAGLVGLCQHLISNENLLYLAFLDATGRVVAAAQKPHTLAGLLDEGGQHLTGPHGRRAYRSARSPGNAFGLEASVPIEVPGVGSSETATFLMATDLQPLRAQLASMAQRIIESDQRHRHRVIAGGFVVMRRLVRPINSLASAALDLAYKHEFHQLPAAAATSSAG